MGGHDPMEMDYGTCSDVMREKMQEPPMPFLRRCIGTCCSKCCAPDVVNSFVWRLFMSVTILPILSWWLIGFVFVPFVELGSSSKEGEAEPKAQTGRPLPSRTRARVAQRERAEWIRKRLKDASASSESIGAAASASATPRVQELQSKYSVPSSSASVRMYIPRCKFLVNARKLYGSSGGDRACKNE